MFKVEQPPLKEDDYGPHKCVFFSCVTVSNVIIFGGVAPLGVTNRNRRGVNAPYLLPEAGACDSSQPEDEEVHRSKQLFLSSLIVLKCYISGFP